MEAWLERTEFMQYLEDAGDFLKIPDPLPAAES